MNPRKLITAIVIGIILIALLFFLRSALKIMTAYTAKYACSSHFIAGFGEDRLAIDLGFVPIKYVPYKIDEEEQSVKASLFGVSSTAYFRCDASGCGAHFEETPVSDIKLNVVRFDTRRAWPYGDGEDTTVVDKVDYDALQVHLDTMLTQNASTLAICVAYDGHLIAEGYGEGVSSSTRLLGWSMTKTMANALIGRLVQQGKISLDDERLLPEWESDERKSIKLSHLLQMNSGLKFSENYFMISDVTRMLYMRPGCYDYAKGSKLGSEPGTDWYYSSGTSNILSGILRSRHEDEESYHSFPQRELFDKLGMRSALIERDGQGDFVLSSYGWATARDWTKFGQLYLQDGLWDGEQVLPAGWVEWSTSPAAGSDGAYGAQIWLNHGELSIPNVPPDAYFENGFGGQRVLVIPSKKMVITVLSGMQMDFDFEGLYAGIFAAVEG